MDKLPLDKIPRHNYRIFKGDKILPHYSCTVFKGDFDRNFYILKVSLGDFDWANMSRVFCPGVFCPGCLSSGFGFSSIYVQGATVETIS